MSAALLFAQALAPVFAVAPVPDAVLGELRGGVELPNGIDLALTVQTQTAIDGSVVLRTVFALVDGPPKIFVYTPPAGQAVAASPASLAGANGAGIGPTVTYELGQGVQVIPGLTVIPVVVGQGAQEASSAGAGLEQIDASHIATDAGIVDRSPQAISLTGSDFSVTHFIGGAFGSAIANTGSDRTINTMTTVSIDLRNAGPEVLGSALLRVEDVAIGALASRY